MSARAFAVNAEAPGRLAGLCHERRLPLVHISTDYVFDGRQAEPYREDDAINPLSVYGASKAAGEAAVRAALPRHIVLRTSWVFGAGGRNFVTTMLRLAETMPDIRVVDDQRGGPTGARYLADAVSTIAGAVATGREDCWGTYHLAGAPTVSWYDFAAVIFAEWADLTGIAEPRLRPIPTAEFPTAAQRPANAILDCRRIEAVFGVLPGNWRRDLRAMLEDIRRERGL